MTTEVLAGYAPCPTCKQYSHSLRDDLIGEAHMHFETMYSHRGDGFPTQHLFDEKTRDLVQRILAALSPVAGASFAEIAAHEARTGRSALGPVAGASDVREADDQALSHLWDALTAMNDVAHPGWNALTHVKDRLADLRPPNDPAVVEALTTGLSWMNALEVGENIPPHLRRMAKADRAKFNDALATLTQHGAPVGGWQPIETAPKDGSWLFVCEVSNPDIVGDYYAAAWVRTPYEGNPHDGYWIANCGQFVTETPSPTHWQPLPAPPALRAPVGGEGA